MNDFSPKFNFAQIPLNRRLFCVFVEIRFCSKGHFDHSHKGTAETKVVSRSPGTFTRRDWILTCPHLEPFVCLRLMHTKTIHSNTLKYITSNRVHQSADTSKKKKNKFKSEIICVSRDFNLSEAN